MPVCLAVLLPTHTLSCFSCLHRVAWDVEASMGQDNLLGGAPGPYYCILACEQWNSPLYCDSEHPQVCQDMQQQAMTQQLVAHHVNTQ